MNDEEYCRHAAPIEAERDRRLDSIDAKRDRRAALAREEHDRRMAKIVKEYDRQAAPAWEEYRRRMALLDAEHDRKAAPAGKRLHLTRDTVRGSAPAPCAGSPTSYCTLLTCVRSEK